MTTTTDSTQVTIGNCRFVSQRLHTDTVIYEVIARTAHTMTLRDTIHTDRVEPDRRCDEGAYGLRPMWVEVEPFPAGETYVVRRRKDGTFGLHRGRTLQPVTGTPRAWIDYRY